MRQLFSKVKKHYLSHDWLTWSVGSYDYEGEETKTFEIKISKNHTHILVSFEHDKEHYYKVEPKVLIQQLLESVDFIK